MQRIITPRLIPALLSIAFAGTAAASGFQLYGEQGAQGIGNAGAGSAVAAENASTVYYNPAGMTQLPQYAVSVGLSAVYTTFKFSDGGSTTGAFTTAGDGGNGGGWGFIPNMYGTMALTKDIYIGLGIGAPYGLKVQYNEPWIGSAQSNMFDIKTLNINPSIAWRATDWMSLGLGANYQRIDATYERNLLTAVPGIANPVANAAAAQASGLNMTLSDDAWGWNVGAIFTLAPQTKLGIAYRSKIKYKTDGDVAAYSPSPLLAAAASSNVKASIDLPDTFALSISQGIGENWELLGDISWTGWSSIPQVDIMRSSGAATGTTAQVLETHFDDAWRFAVGANYKLSDSIKLRFGLAYDQTPVPNAQYRLTSLPDNDRIWFATGAQWKPAKDTAVDFGLAYIYMQDPDIDRNELAQGRGYVKGSYDNSVWLMGVQFSMGF